MAGVVLESRLTCPECGHASTQAMPTDACVWYFECPGCGVLLKSLQGDCGVFWSYGSIRCPPVQLDRHGGCRA